MSAVAPEHRSIDAPARVFRTQRAFVEAFQRDELEQDFVAVVTHQGPRSNGMPELHKLTPYLGLLQNRGHRVALLTDGRMSGASGKVLAAIHLTPEAASDGPIAKLRDGDRVHIDATAGVLEVGDCPDFESRTATAVEPAPQSGMGRELFAAFRDNASSAETGATLFDEGSAAGAPRTSV